MDTKLDRLALRSELVELKKRVAELEERIENLGAEG
jgi:polyhydroxyalkanoate synthesis regulator phasin